MLSKIEMAWGVRFDCSSLLTDPRTNIKDPSRENVKFHGDGESQVLRYRFNTKEKDQMFCGKCGASLGIDFRDFYQPKWTGYGISVSLLSGREDSRLMREGAYVQDGIG